MLTIPNYTPEPKEEVKHEGIKLHSHEAPEDDAYHNCTATYIRPAADIKEFAMNCHYFMCIIFGLTWILFGSTTSAIIYDPNKKTKWYT